MPTRGGCWRNEKVWAVLGVAFLAGTAVALVLLGRATYACYGEQYDSIHFHSGIPDYGVPPRRAVINWRGDQSEGGDEYGGAERSNLELEEWQDSERQTEIARKRGLMMQAADAAIRAGQWGTARKRIEQFGNHYHWRGGMRDRVEMLRQLETLHPSPTQLAAVNAYLDGMKADEAGDHKAAQAAFVKVQNDPAAGFLREHALYQQASLAAELFDYPRAVDLYAQLLAQYPRTAKREDALVMTARCALLPQTPGGRRVEQGKAALALLRKEFPHTRFQRDLAGLQGRLFFLAGQWAQAAHCYYINDDLASVERVLKAMPPDQRGPIRVSLLGAYLRALTTTKHYNSFAHALLGADHTRQAMTSPQLAQFRQTLLHQPDTAAAYLYYRLYYTDCKAADRRQLAQFADRIIALHPAAQLAVPVQVRLAEVYYGNHQYRRALSWADRALRPGLNDRALYIRAATLNKLGQPARALADFKRLVDRLPASPLVHGAQENLAILYEARHEFGRALDEYFNLDYSTDIAYLLDVRMSPSEIAAYLQHVPTANRHENIDWTREHYYLSQSHYSRHDLVAYSLGIRYLRDERWADARRLLSSLPAKAYRELSNPTTSDGYKVATTEPLHALADLEKLKNVVDHARTPNARASALYHLAAYYTGSDLLLLYNAALWQGARDINFDIYWDRKHATPDMRAAVRRHMYAHETYARSHKLCMEVIHRYPHAPTVPYALFLAAIDSLHLAQFNRWWDDEDDRYHFLNEVYRFKRRLVREFPHHHLAAKVREHTRIYPEEKNLYWRPQRMAREWTVDGRQ